VEEGKRLVAQALESAGIGLLGMREMQPRMEEAFISLIRRQLQGESDNGAG